MRPRPCSPPRWNPLDAAAGRSLGIALKHNRCVLTYLDLGFSGLGDEGATYVAKALESNSNLRVLKMASASLRDEGACMIAQGVTANHGLVELSIPGKSVTWLA